MLTPVMIAQIKNDVLKIGYGGDPTDKSAAFTNYLVLLWRTLILVGGLATLLFLLWGALDWILAGGDEGKVSSARQKMTGAVIGLVILASTIAIVELIGGLIGIDLLDICFPGPGVTCY
jgi:hypothetical protein